MTILTFSAGSDDCWGSSDYDLVTGNTAAYVGGTNNIGYNVRNWIPFNVNLPKGLLIAQALIKWVAVEPRSDYITANIGCEAVVNPSVPSSRADLFARVQTGSKTSVVFETYVAGNQYSYNITTAIQEMLNNPGWSYGSKLAVLVIGNADNDHRRQIATVENPTYQEPLLEISFNAFIPVAGMI